MADNSTHDLKMRAPCSRCGAIDGGVTETGTQDVVRCINGHYCYNAPRLETGKAVRSLTSRPGITPAQRARILAAHDNACISCGQRPPDVALQLDHLISREDAAKFDLLDDLIDSEWNLAPMCAECNSGKRVLGSAGIRLIYRALLLKSRAAAA